jgi:hypothetical protein
MCAACALGSKICMLTISPGDEYELKSNLNNCYSNTLARAPISKSRGLVEPHSKDFHKMKVVATAALEKSFQNEKRDTTHTRNVIYQKSDGSKNDKIVLGIFGKAMRIIL